MSMAYVAVAISVVGTAISATGTYEAGQSQKAAADYNAKVQNNAAKDALQRGADSAEQNTEKTRRLLATQNATMGANGLVTSTGTPLDILTNTAGLGELDSLRLLNNAQRDASGLTTQANLTQFQGNQAADAGTLGAAATVLGGASKAYYGDKGATVKEFQDAAGTYISI